MERLRVSYAVVLTSEDVRLPLYDYTGNVMHADSSGVHVKYAHDTYATLYPWHRVLTVGYNPKDQT